MESAGLRKRPVRSGLIDEGHIFPLDGMEDRQGAGVKGQGFVTELDLRSVPEITDHGMAQMSELYTDLVMTARGEFDLDPGDPFRVTKTTEREPGLPPPFFHHTTPPSLSGQAMFHASPGGDLPFNQHPIDLSHLPITKLPGKTSRRLGGTGKEEDPGGRTIEAVNNREVDISRFPEPFLEERTGGIEKGRIPGPVPLNQHACRFMHHKQMIVQKENFQFFQDRFLE